MFLRTSHVSVICDLLKSVTLPTCYATVRSKAGEKSGRGREIKDGTDKRHVPYEIPSSLPLHLLRHSARINTRVERAGRPPSVDAFTLFYEVAFVVWTKLIATARNRVTMRNEMIFFSLSSVEWRNIVNFRWHNIITWHAIEFRCYVRILRQYTR